MYPFSKRSRVLNSILRTSVALPETSLHIQIRLDDAKGFANSIRRVLSAPPVIASKDSERLNPDTASKCPPSPTRSVGRLGAGVGSVGVVGEVGGVGSVGEVGTVVCDVGSVGEVGSVGDVGEVVDVVAVVFTELSTVKLTVNERVAVAFAAETVTVAVYVPTASEPAGRTSNPRLPEVGFMLSKVRLPPTHSSFPPP
jgi:hypothetical protein